MMVNQNKEKEDEVSKNLMEDFDEEAALGTVRRRKNQSNKNKKRKA